jgi:peptide deformylase
MEAALNRSVDPVGVGLAAVQVGKPIKIFIAKPTEKSKIYVFINAQIVKTSEKLGVKKSKVKKLEGCLSLPNIWGEVARYENVTIKYLDETGKSHKKKFSGFMATIIQHEMDHLAGILFTKRVLEQKGTLYRSEKNKNGEDVFEEIKI